MNQLKIKRVNKIEVNAHLCVGGDTANQQEVLLALPDKQEGAKSMRRLLSKWAWRSLPIPSGFE